MTNAKDCAARLADLLRREHAALADFLLALAAFDARRAWLELGHPSLFSFLHRELGLSTGAAYHRKVAAELVQRFPAVVEPLRDGRLCITSVVELAKVLSPENCDAVLPRFFRRSKREARELSAELRPAVVVPRRELVTGRGGRREAVAGQRGTSAEPATSDGVGDPPMKEHELPGAGAKVVPGALCARPASADQLAHVGSTAAPNAGAGATSAASIVDAGGSPAAPIAATRALTPATVAPGFHPDETFSLERTPTRDAVEPLTADLRRLHVTVSRRFLAKLDAARAALSHSRPRGDTEEVLEAALDLLLATHARRKAAVRKRPLAGRGERARIELLEGCSLGTEPNDIGAASEGDIASGGGAPRSGGDDRYIPAAVRREVWNRDGGCCQWPLAAGGGCGSRTRVEFDHVVPRALGGSSSVGNVRLLCRIHNGAAARLHFGDACMDRYARGSAGSGPLGGRRRPAERAS